MINFMSRKSSKQLEGNGGPSHKPNWQVYAEVMLGSHNAFVF